VGGAGGGLGYTGIANSIAVKFDIYNAAAHTSSTGIYFDGEPPDSPAGRARSVFMASTGIDFNSGHVFRIDLAYDSLAHVLTETVTDNVTKAVFRTSYSVDIAAHLGSNEGYVGFGGGTGGNTAIQDILNWTYSTQDPGQPGGNAQVAQAPAATAAPAAVVATDPAPSTDPASSAPAAAPSTDQSSPAPVATVIPQSLDDTAAVDAVLESYPETPKSRTSALLGLATS
jgi:hypothetical protein